MKSPRKQISATHQQKQVPHQSLSHTSKAHSLFEQQSHTHRSKSMDQKVSELNDKQIFSSIKQRDYRKAISLLHQLETYIQNQSTNQTSRKNKLLLYYELSVCYYNHAVVYQKVSNDEETAKYFQKALKNLEHMQGYITSREEGVSHSIEVAKLQIQYCSILSQTGKHQQAITYGEKALLKLIQCFRILEAICFQFVMENRLPETTSNSRDINFKKFVVFEAQKMLKELSSLPEPHQLPTQFRKKYDSLMQKTFFWKDNSQNNQKQLRKQLQIQRKQVNSDRNILGVQKNSFLNENLTLQALTNLQAKSIKYSFNNDPFYLLSTPKLTQMAFYVAMVYFMIATEIRFSQVDLNVQKLKIDQKYKKLSQDERMIKCKMIHMKAIEIAGKFLPEKNEFFTHIMNRFNKNYKCVMEEINEESKEQSVKELSGENDRSGLDSKDILPEEEYGIQNECKNNDRSDNLRFSVKPKPQQAGKNSSSTSLGSFKKLKKGKMFQFNREEQNQNRTPFQKRKLSSNRQKQNLSIFSKLQRSTSQTHAHKRSVSLHRNDRSNSSTKMIGSYNGESQKRQRTKTVTPSVKKGEERLMRKKSYQEEAFGRVNLGNVENIVNSPNHTKINQHLSKEFQLKQDKQKSKDIKLRPKGLVSPISKRKLCNLKTKVKTQQNNDYGDMSGKPEKRFKLLHRNLHN